MTQTVLAYIQKTFLNDSYIALSRAVSSRTGLAGGSHWTTRLRKDVVGPKCLGKVECLCLKLIKPHACLCLGRSKTGSPLSASWG